MVHLISDVAPYYNLTRTIRSGQIFLFNEVAGPENTITFVVQYGNRRCSISDKGVDGVQLSCPSVDVDYWVEFFGIKEKLSDSFYAIMQSNGWLREALCYASGIRLIKQDPWQALISFIVSQNNNIPRIAGCLRSLCDNFGSLNSEHRFHAFPTPEQLIGKDLSVTHLGYRDRYVLGAAEAVANGTLKLENLTPDRCTLNDAITELLRLDGVGIKVANCIALFGLGYRNAFPVDLWVRKAMTTANITLKDVRMMGDDAGLVQQHMYHYIRNGKLG